MPQTPPPAPVATQTTGSTPTELYRAAQLARTELREQRDELRGQREELRRELQGAQSLTDKQGVEARLAALDARLADVDKQLAAADALVAQRAAQPGVVIHEPSRGNDDIPPGAMIMSGLGMLLLLLMPVSIAFARRIWRRAGGITPALPSDLAERFNSMERGIEAVSIEVERLGEGQRFMTQLLAEGEKRRQMQALPTDRTDR